jgi:hypothetical protein
MKVEKVEKEESEDDEDFYGMSFQPAQPFKNISFC